MGSKNKSGKKRPPSEVQAATISNVASSPQLVDSLDTPTTPHATMTTTSAPTSAHSATAPSAANDSDTDKTAAAAKRSTFSFWPVTRAAAPEPTKNKDEDPTPHMTIGMATAFAPTSAHSATAPSALAANDSDKDKTAAAAKRSTFSFWPITRAVASAAPEPPKDKDYDSAGEEQGIAEARGDQLPGEAAIASSIDGRQFASSTAILPSPTTGTLQKRQTMAALSKPRKPAEAMTRPTSMFADPRRVAITNASLSRGATPPGATPPAVTPSVQETPRGISASLPSSARESTRSSTYSGIPTTHRKPIRKTSHAPAVIGSGRRVQRMMTTDGKCQRVWEKVARCLTCWAPDGMLKRMKKTEPGVQQAWREKTALCTIFFLMMAALAFFTFGYQAASCPPPDVNQFAVSMIKPVVGSAATPTPGRVMINGMAYDLADWWGRGHKKVPAEVDPLMIEIAGLDLSFMFPRATPSCPVNIPRKCSVNAVYPEVNATSGLPEFCHFDALLTQLDPIGVVYYEWSDIARPDSKLFGYNGMAVDMAPYYAANPQWISKEQLEIVESTFGRDATRALGIDPELQALAKCLIEAYGVGAMERTSFVCTSANIILWISLIIISLVVVVRFVLAVAFSWFLSKQLGHIDSTKWFAFNRKKGAIEVAPPGTGVTAATHPQSFSLFSKVDLSYRYRELYTMCLVTCYSEDTSGLRATLDSLSETDYHNDYKMIFVVADGIVKGSGNAKPTGDLVLDMIELDPVMHGPVSRDYVKSEKGDYERVSCRNAEALSYVAIGSGSKRHNMAKVYCGTYKSPSGKKTAVVLVYKWGTPAEHEGAKPGNRGKRDSQIILMDFLSKLMFDEGLTPHQFDLFTKWSHIMTTINGNTKRVTPDNFEIILMVDADTKVMPDSLSRMVAVMQRDPMVMGLCGETRISNKNASFTTMIQVFEYHISHHMSKAFESVFGGVTCLPGCFCMYRIKAPKADPSLGFLEGPPPEEQCSWVPIVNNPDIVADYSESVVDTLHKKNLLLLGEDRYLTTLMLRTFPKRKMLFVPKAVCKTEVPAQFSVLLSQRRRWINSTIHNMFELVLVNELCGIFCFSMQFIIALELFGTVTLPAAITFTTAVLIIGILALAVPGLSLQFPLVPLLLLAGILGLPAVLIGFTTRRMIYIWYMVIYLFALPIWNFVLPVYAWLHFDDFSWGQTRQVAGEKKGGDAHGHGGDAVLDPTAAIPRKRWEQWERERRATLRANGETDYIARGNTLDTFKLVEDPQQPMLTFPASSLAEALVSAQTFMSAETVLSAKSGVRKTKKLHRRNKSGGGDRQETSQPAMTVVEVPPTGGSAASSKKSGTSASIHGDGDMGV